MYFLFTLTLIAKFVRQTKGKPKLMTKKENIFSAKKIKKAFITLLKVSLVLTLAFMLLFKQFTLKGIAVIFLISLMYSFVLGFGQGLLNDYLSLKYDWIKQTNRRVWAGIIATVLYTVPAVLFSNYILFVKIQGLDNSLFFKSPAYWIHLFYILISFFVSAILHARSFMLEWKKSVKQETTEHKIIAKTESAKFETLKNQIDPHFLFNSLNVLTSLISENPNKAEKFTTKLSKVYRYVLEQRNKKLVPIAEELQFAKTYIELLQMRFEDALQFKITEQLSQSELKIVPLSLQLLLENAVKHNVVSSAKPLKIKFYEENGFLKVKNNINPKEAIGKSTKVGLRNIADRYGLITSKNVSILNNNKTFVVSLPLLKQLKNMEKINTKKIENSNYIKAVKRVEKLKDFYNNIASYVIVIPFLVFINLKMSPGYHWFWFPAISWGIGIIFHWLEINNYNFFLGKNWEKRKIIKIMKQNENDKK